MLYLSSIFDLLIEIKRMDKKENMKDPEGLP